MRNNIPQLQLRIIANYGSLDSCPIFKDIRGNWTCTLVFGNPKEFGVLPHPTGRLQEKLLEDCLDGQSLVELYASITAIGAMGEQAGGGGSSGGGATSGVNGGGATSGVNGGGRTTSGVGGGTSGVNGGVGGGKGTLAAGQHVPADPAPGGSGGWKGGDGGTSTWSSGGASSGTGPRLGAPVGNQGAGTTSGNVGCDEEVVEIISD